MTISLGWPIARELCISLPDMIWIYWDRNLQIRDFEQNFPSDQPEPPDERNESRKRERISIDSHCLAPEGDDDVTERENHVFVLELILANSLSDFLSSRKVWVISMLPTRLPLSDLFNLSSTETSATMVLFLLFRKPTDRAKKR
jgi:hypothetical protein